MNSLEIRSNPHFLILAQRVQNKINMSRKVRILYLSWKNYMVFDLKWIVLIHLRTQYY